MAASIAEASTFGIIVKNLTDPQFLLYSENQYRSSAPAGANTMHLPVTFHQLSLVVRYDKHHDNAVSAARQPSVM